MKMNKISWFTPPVSEAVGYGVAAIETIQALQRKGLSVQWNDDRPLVHINFIQPEFYSGNEKQYRIGYTPWESTEIQEMWPSYMNQMNEVWTTSNFCKEVYEKNGVNDVWVLPHGFDPETFQIVDRTPSKKFVFLHIGGPTERKGGKMVAKAFVELFDKNEDVFLLMKSNGPSEARYTDSNGVFQGNIANHPRVQVITTQISVEDMFKLYEAAHCCVYPTLGEGFGLIPFQAIATGLPTITTNLTGTADFAELSMPLSATWQDGFGVHKGLWAKPDYDELLELMSDAYNNWETHKKKAFQSARVLHNTQTWDHIADRVIDRLGDKVSQEVEGAE
jgi:glycosyltransferase involved in cell wall biosynthesis